jgi:hypothetical protein
VSRRRFLPRYGRLEVGQHVTFERCVPAPGSRWGRDSDVVTVRTEHVITDMRESETGAIVELTDADGCVLSRNFDSYGNSWGGFGTLRVTQNAPYQARLV